MYQKEISVKQKCHHDFKCLKFLLSADKAKEKFLPIMLSSMFGETQNISAETFHTNGQAWWWRSDDMGGFTASKWLTIIYILKYVWFKYCNCKISYFNLSITWLLNMYFKDIFEQIGIKDATWFISVLCTTSITKIYFFAATPTVVEKKTKQSTKHNSFTVTVNICFNSCDSHKVQLKYVQIMLS